MKTKIVVLTILLSLSLGLRAQEAKLDWQKFIAKQDMQWDRIPDIWQEAPYLGNGMIGLMLFQPKKTNKNELQLHVGRGDYYDNRPPIDGRENTWIYRSRLPIGYFKLKSKAEITKVDWRLDLWNATLNGTVETKEGTYQFKAIVHALYDAFSVDITQNDGEEVKIEWIVDKAYSYAREASDRHVERMKEKSGSPYKTFAAMPYDSAPAPMIVENEGVTQSVQTLFAKSGEQVTSWKEVKKGDNIKLFGSVHFSKTLGVSKEKTLELVKKAEKEYKKGKFVKYHNQWWNDYYQQSFLSISDEFWEQFYWIQLYKFAAATRSNGMLLDVMGPWYQPPFWPLIWTDLNVQLTYWTPLTANRLDVGASLPNQMDKYKENLKNNLPKGWCDECLNAGTVFPADMKAQVGKGVSDHLVWMLHDYWLWCVYADDDERMKNGLFPLLKGATNTYFKYIEDNPMKEETDGKIHFKNTWSPEYPGGRGKDINYTIALVNWACKTLLDISQKYKLNDPKEAEWKRMLDNIVEYQIDETGLRVGADIPFDKSHRHYSHLLSFYPLYLHTPDKDYDLLKKSVDHWLETSFDVSKKKDGAMNVTGYTCTGAASMYASLGDGNTALSYLRLLPFNNVSPTTMYSEGNNPVIESPFSAATSMHDLLLQSWDGKIRVFPAVPDTWKNIHFKNLLAQGGIEVSADKTEGVTQYVLITSPKKTKEIAFKIDFTSPTFFKVKKNGKKEEIKLKKNSKGFYQITLEKEESVLAKNKKAISTVQPVKSGTKNSNIFGNNEKYDRIIEEYGKSKIKG